MPRIGGERLLQMLHLAENEAAFLGATPESEEIAAVKTFQIALHRGRQNHILADNQHPGVEGRIEYPGKLRCPHSLWDVLERWAAVGLLVDGDNGRGGRGGGVDRTVEVMAQPIEAVDRQAVGAVEYRQLAAGRSTERDQQDKQPGA